MYKIRAQEEEQKKGQLKESTLFRQLEFRNRAPLGNYHYHCRFIITYTTLGKTKREREREIPTLSLVYREYARVRRCVCVILRSFASSLAIFSRNYPIKRCKPLTDFLCLPFFLFIYFYLSFEEAECDKKKRCQPFFRPLATLKRTFTPQSLTFTSFWKATQSFIFSWRFLFYSR